MKQRESAGSSLNARSMEKRLQDARRAAAQHGRPIVTPAFTLWDGDFDLAKIPTRLKRIVRETVARTEAQRARLVIELESELATAADQGKADLIRQTLVALRGNEAPFFGSLPTTAAGTKTMMVEAQIKRYVEHLERYAVRGNSRCLELLAEVALGVVTRLNELVQSPRFATKLKPFAERCYAWPVLKSPHPHFSQKEQELFDMLNVGEGVDPVLDRCAKWKPRSEQGKLVLEFLNEAIRIRQNATRMQVLRPLNDWEKAVTKLEPLKKDPDAWFDLAKRYFEQRPEKLSALNRKVCGWKGKGKRVGVSSHVWTELRRKFRSLAGKTAELARNRRPTKRRCSN